MIKLIAYSAIMSHLIIMISLICATICIALKQYILGAVFAGYGFRELMNALLCTKEVDDEMDVLR